MKTTIDIADPLWRQAKDLAARRGVTFRELVEAGLARVIAEGSPERPAFRLRDASFRGGRGLQKEFEGASWSEILAAAYEGRG